MKKRVDIFIFVDALGWKIVCDNKFLIDELPFRTPVEMQFGYSSSAIPTILSGKRPDKHGHLSFYYFDKEQSPFKVFRFISGLATSPHSLLNRGRVRNIISKTVKKLLGYTGYFQLYSVPFARLPYLNYCEKSDIFAPGGLGQVRNLRDELSNSKLNFLISDWRNSEENNLNEAATALRNGQTDFMFIYTAGFDALLHEHVMHPKVISDKLNFYTTKIRDLLNIAQEQDIKLNLTVISDHGMTPLAGTVDLKNTIENCGKLKFGRDLLVCYDSTMMRIKYLKNDIKEKVMKLVEESKAPGHWISCEDKKRYGIDFADNRYGDDIFLLDPGWQIVPSDMGSKPLNGMHGFLPEDEYSTASALSNTPFPFPLTHVEDFFRMMKFRIDEINANFKE